MPNLLLGEIFDFVKYIDHSCLLFGEILNIAKYVDRFGCPFVCWYVCMYVRTLQVAILLKACR